jgi:Trk K+ transport system NAD-binding subunit
MTAADVRSDIREYLLPEASPLVGLTIAEADRQIRRGTGCLLIGYGRRGSDGEYQTVVNPPFDQRLAPGDAVILICTLENARRSRAFFGTEQGR